MLFSSWEYILFFFAVIIFYFSIQHKFRIYLLLGASYYFYMSWRWEFGFLMLAVSLVNFYLGKKIWVTSERRKKNMLLAVSVVVSLLPLIYFKYANFLLESVGWLATKSGFEITDMHVAVILPVGISFFTFQALSYSLDIYRENTKPEESAVHFLTFVAFFPQLIAGPIERSVNMLPQFKREHTVDLKRFVEGGQLFIWGLFKKIVIADRLALYSDPVFNNPEVYSGPTLLLATLFFTFQIYCDFSGYSDMAIGSARILGFKLMQNFNLPYLAKSIGEFWKRWHISLSTWFADYVYIPLGGNRVEMGRWFFNIMVVFLVSGLWHGANWTFVVWGGLHGLYYIIEFFWKRILDYFNLEGVEDNKLYKVIKIIITFLLVMYSWIFFRANSLYDALYISDKIFDFSGQLWWGASSVTTLFSLLLIGLLMIVQILQYNKVIPNYIGYGSTDLPRWVSWAAFILLLLGISLFGISSNAFIYFQF